MATVPTPEETAHEILNIFVEDFQCRPLEGLPLQSVKGTFDKRNIRREDFSRQLNGRLHNYARARTAYLREI